MRWFLKILFCILLSFNFYVAQARDIDWDDIRVESSYSQSDENIKVIFTVDHVYTSPELVYSISYRVNNDTYVSSFSYNDGNHNLTATLDIGWVDENELRSSYGSSFKILDEENNIPYSDTNYTLIIGESDEKVFYDDFSWSDIEINEDYNQSSQRLNLNISLDNIIITPKYQYSVNIDFASWSTLVDLEYDTRKQELRTDIFLDLDPRKIQENYSISVVNKYYDYTIFEKTWLSVDVELEDHIVWANPSVLAYYDDIEKMIIWEISIDDISTEPFKNYTASIDIENTDSIDVQLVYNEEAWSLEGGFEIELQEKYITYFMKYDIALFSNEENSIILYSSTWKKITIWSDHNIDDIVIPWDNFLTMIEHDSENKSLALKFYIPSIFTKPEDAYQLQFSLKWLWNKVSEHILEFKYIEESYLFAELIITNIETQGDNIYVTDIEIYNLDLELQEYKIHQVELSSEIYLPEKPKEVQEEQELEEEEVQEETNTQKEDIPQRVYNAIINKTSDLNTSDSIVLIKSMIVALDWYIWKYPELESVLNKIISLLKAEVKRLNLEWYYTSH